MGLGDRFKNLFDSHKNFSYLEELIHTGSGEITLDCDIVLDDFEQDRYLNGIELDVDNLVIDGNGHSIDACGKTRIFHCRDKRVTIKNIVLKNGFSTDYGGAIYNNGDLHIIDSLLSGNASQEGGAIYNTGDLSIVDSKLSDNLSKYGGAVSNYHGRVSLKNSNLSNNIAEEEGGGINTSSNLNIDNSTLCENKSKKGGGIFAEKTGIGGSDVELNIISSSLSGNMADNGGAVCAERTFKDDFSTLCLNIEYSDFFGNAADNGSAIYNHQAFLHMTGSKEENNIAKSEYGYAIYNDGEMDIIDSALASTICNNNYLKLHNTQFDNSCNNGIWIITDESSFNQLKTVINNGNIVVPQSTEDFDGIYKFKQLEADQRSFGYMQELLDGDGDEITLEHDIVLDISEVKDFFTNGLTVDKDNISINGNGHVIDAQGAAPIFDFHGGKITLENIILKNGFSFSDAVIYNHNKLDMYNIIVSDCKAADGNAVICNVGELNISDSDFCDNKVASGNIINNLMSCKIMDCEFADNTSLEDIILNNDSLQILDSIFKCNDSNQIIRNGKKDSTMNINSEFITNNIKKSVIDNSGKYCVLDRCVFEDNLSFKNSNNITNNSDLTLINPKTDTNEKTVLNEGHILIKKSYHDFKNMIYGDGSVESNEDISPVQSESDFTYLDKIIHESTTKEIVLDKDIILGSYETDFYEGGIELDIDDLVIDGNGVTIDGAAKSRIFLITGKNITLKNIIFKNGVSHKNYDNPLNSMGGALKINSYLNLTLIGCEFINNISQDNGGVIYNSDGSFVDIVKCIFNQSKSDISGGAISNYGKLKAAESIFKDNSSNMGGGAISNHGELELIANEFIKNYSGNGGAISNFGKLGLTGDKFVENKSDQEGGGITTKKNSILNAEKCIFIKNSSFLGGGINTDKGADFTIKDSCFKKNSANQSGAIYDSTIDSVVHGCKYLTESDKVKYLYDE